MPAVWFTVWVAAFYATALAHVFGARGHNEVALLLIVGALCAVTGMVRAAVRS